MPGVKKLQVQDRGSSGGPQGPPAGGPQIAAEQSKLALFGQILLYGASVGRGW